MTTAERKHLSFEREPDLFVLAGSARGLLSRRATVDCKNRRIQKYTRVCTVCVLPYGRRGYVKNSKIVCSIETRLLFVPIVVSFPRSIVISASIRKKRYLILDDFSQAIHVQIKQFNVHLHETVIQSTIPIIKSNEDH